MNVWHIVTFNRGNPQPGDVELIVLGEGRMALVFLANDETDVHGGENVRRAIKELRAGNTIHVLREMICSNCGNFYPRGTHKCDCMTK